MDEKTELSKDSRLIRWSEAFGRFIGYVLGICGIVVVVVLVIGLVDWATSSDIDLAALAEPPIAMPTDVDPARCIYEIRCVTAAFLQMAVTGSTVEPSEQWSIDKWMSGTTTIAVYGFDNIDAAYRDSASYTIKQVIDLHNGLGGNFRRAEPGEEGDISIFFTSDPEGDRQRFKQESELALFDQLYVASRPTAHARCWERSAVWRHISKERSVIVIPTNHAELPQFFLLRCIMEEMTHGMSPLRRDLDAPAATFFLQNDALTTEWALQLSPLDQVLLIIGYNSAIKQGDGVEVVVNAIEDIYPMALATYCQSHICEPVFDQ